MIINVAPHGIFTGVVYETNKATCQLTKQYDDATVDSAVSDLLGLSKSPFTWGVVGVIYSNGTLDGSANACSEVTMTAVVSTRKHFGSSRKHFGSTRKHFGSSRKHFGSTRKHFGSSRKHFGSSRKHFGSTRKHFGSSRIYEHTRNIFHELKKRLYFPLSPF